MASFLFNIILWTLAIYGLFELVKSIIHTYYQPKASSSGIYLFVGVKNQENKVEGFIRSVLFRLVYGKEENINNIFVFDLNSSDKTSDILDMLSKDYDFIKFTDVKHCKEFLDSVLENDWLERFKNGLVNNNESKRLS